MIVVNVKFTFPGEGAIIDGASITPDTPIRGIEELAQLPSYNKNLKPQAERGRVNEGSKSPPSHDV